eukprot:TRINITY_DN7695_c0_g1_i1.p2 TRINITY_DN7695_c0_g1~~TRINITY_DN7695_c0_g1_i1.p2  ORF type:complete len:165 (+),score=11.55 TRINITY_DN7695_c0_g1_i1:115-609(+)
MVASLLHLASLVSSTEDEPARPRTASTTPSTPDTASTHTNTKGADTQNCFTDGACVSRTTVAVTVSNTTTPTTAGVAAATSNTSHSSNIPTQARHTVASVILVITIANTMDVTDDGRRQHCRGRSGRGRGSRHLIVVMAFRKVFDINNSSGGVLHRQGDVEVGG